jgi:hypothetical protein
MSEPKYKEGQRISRKGRTALKIMAFREGWYMARLIGCVPFVARENEIDNMVGCSNDTKPAPKGYDGVMPVECDESCFYHCTKGGQQPPECMKTKNYGTED